MLLDSLRTSPFLKLLLILSILLLIIAFASYKIFVIRGQQLSELITDVNPDQNGLATQLHKHVQMLSVGIGERHYELPDSLKQTVDYIVQEFLIAGLEPRLQDYSDGNYTNVVTEISGKDKNDEILVIGAHYDTVWLSPGADDNATGVAALLEIARSLSRSNPGRTIRFIAFANEEQPFSETNRMGSRVYASSAKENDENIVGMISLEMLGYYSGSRDSQHYPAVASLFYPDTADFIAFVGNLYSRKLLVNAIINYKNDVVPAQGLAVPEYLVPDIRRSDHASFWDYQFPAIMITDTANYRNINYHTVGDTIETLDFDRMSAVVSGLTGMIKNMANSH